MYRKNQQAKIKVEEFEFSIEGGKLDGENRWIIMAELIPWEEFEVEYAKQFSKGMGAPAKSFRIALGALIIKEIQGISDRETVEQIKENPYLQYFIGRKKYSKEAPFEASMLVHFRERIGIEMVSRITRKMVEKEVKEAGVAEKQEKKSGEKGVVENRGKLILDASCLPADISYPRDINLLNKAREITEKVIDVLYKNVGGKTSKKGKPRTYRRLARKDYLAIAKEKNPRVEKRRKGIKKQLAYIKRNLSHIDKLLSEGASLESLKRQDYQKLLVVGELYRQQQWMYENQQNRIENRIVSISQPHIRPIVRGKVGKKVEFGAKVSASVIDGYVFIDHISWDNFNESVDLKRQVENYKEYTGYYPESVHADKIYRTRPNIAWCKSKGIRISGLALGRPPKKISKERKKQVASDEKIRNSIEGKFGEGKRRYSLNRIMAKLPHTSLTSIAIIFLVMNLSRLLRQVIWDFFVKNWIIACLTD